jgi:hypothetical protein
MDNNTNTPGFQTTFEVGQDHFSPTHSQHRFGSTAPVQRDLGMRMPDGHLERLAGMDSPPGTEVQAKLTQFGR